MDEGLPGTCSRHGPRTWARCPAHTPRSRPQTLCWTPGCGSQGSPSDTANSHARRKQFQSLIIHRPNLLFWGKNICDRSTLKWTLHSSNAQPTGKVSPDAMRPVRESYIVGRNRSTRDRFWRFTYDCPLRELSKGGMQQHLAQICTSWQPTWGKKKKKQLQTQIFPGNKNKTLIRGTSLSVTAL